MSWIEALVLGVLQGLTEFLPISSSGHLVVMEGFFAALGDRVTSGSEQLFFNVMLHVGTLAAILFFYRDAIGEIGRTVLDRPESSPRMTSRASILRAVILIALATLPAVLVALFFKSEVERATAMPQVAGAGFLVTAVVLVLSLLMRDGSKGLKESLWSDALLIGTAQAIAILPGVSRSGMTIAAALALGFSRTWAVTFSLLMAIPAILGAGVLEVRDLDPSTLTTQRVLQTGAATLAAAVVGYAAILWLFRIVRANRLWYFSVYLVIMAAVVLVSFPIRGKLDVEDTRATALVGSDRLRGVDKHPTGVRASRVIALDRADGDPARPGAQTSGSQD